MSTKISLPNIKIASPCSVRWEDMDGSEQCRFCSACQKHVYNFSKMTSEQISEAIVAKEGKICARFYQRSDGTMLTADCPIGVERGFGRMKKLVWAGVTALVLCGGVFACATPSAKNGTRQKTQIERRWDEAVFKVKAWLGMNPPPVAVPMGKICVMGDVAISPAPQNRTPKTTLVK